SGPRTGPERGSLERSDRQPVPRGRRPSRVVTRLNSRAHGPQALIQRFLLPQTRGRIPSRGEVQELGQCVRASRATTGAAGRKEGALRGALHIPRLSKGVGSSPGWTRTNNPPVNSRMLCQLSYRGRQRARSVAAPNRG